MCLFVAHWGNVIHYSVFCESQESANHINECDHDSDEFPEVGYNSHPYGHKSRSTTNDQCQGVTSFYIQVIFLFLISTGNMSRSDLLLMGIIFQITRFRFVWPREKNTAVLFHTCTWGFLPLLPLPPPGPDYNSFYLTEPPRISGLTRAEINTHSGLN